MQSFKSFITEARLKPVKNVPQDELKAWWKKCHCGRSKWDLEGLNDWNDGVTFEDVYNKLRENGPKDPEKGLWDLIWKKGEKFGNLPYARQWIYRALASRYNIHGGKIDLGYEYASGLRGPGVDYDNFLKKWVHEN